MKKNLDNKGQVLLIVVVTMAVTLGVGLGITSRSTESLKRTGNIDSLQKVTAAAEGALEKKLLLSDEQLEESVKSRTTLTEYFNNDTVSDVTVTQLTAGSSGMIYERIKPSESITFLLSEFSNPIASLRPNTACVKLEIVPSVDYMLNVVTSNPSVAIFEPAITPALSKPVNVIKTNTYLMESYLYSGGSFQGVSPSTNCPNGWFQFSNAYMLRFQPLSVEVTTLTVSTTNTTVQRIIQGFKLTSKGRFKDEIGDKTTRTIEAFKYLDTSSGIYDYTMFLDN